MPLEASTTTIPLAALVIGLLVRLLKTDTRIPIDVPAQHRRKLAYGLGLLAGAFELLGRGVPISDAVLTAVFTPLLAILGHHVGIDMIRGGRELPLPGLMRASTAGNVARHGLVWIVLAGLVVAFAGCTPADRAGVPVLSTVDAIGRGVSRVLGWCEAAGADQSRLERAHSAYRDRDYAQAIALASEMVRDLRAAGADVPEDTELVLRLAEGAMAAQAVQDAMRALSGGS